MLTSYRYLKTTLVVQKYHTNSIVGTFFFRFDSYFTGEFAKQKLDNVKGGISTPRLIG